LPGVGLKTAATSRTIASYRHWKQQKTSPPPALNAKNARRWPAIGKIDPNYLFLIIKKFIYAWRKVISSQKLQMMALNCMKNNTPKRTKFSFQRIHSFAKPSVRLEK
jgi:hypothetical protein